MDDGFTSLRGILDSYGHEIRNRIYPIGGYINLILKNILPDQDKIKRFGTQILHECQRMEDELMEFTKLMVHLFSGEEAKESVPLAQVRNYFQEIPNLCLAGEEAVSEELSLRSYRSILETVFTEMARYIATTGGKMIRPA